LLFQKLAKKYQTENISGDDKKTMKLFPFSQKKIVKIEKYGKFK